MDQDELADRIAQAGDERWTTLDLSGEGLTALPSAMKKLINRGVVKLSENPISG